MNKESLHERQGGGNGRAANPNANSALIHAHRTHWCRGQLHNSYNVQLVTFIRMFGVQCIDLQSWRIAGLVLHLSLRASGGSYKRYYDLQVSRYS